jgi:hypothetical protein
MQFPRDFRLRFAQPEIASDHFGFATAKVAGSHMSDGQAGPSVIIIGACGNAVGKAACGADERSGVWVLQSEVPPLFAQAVVNRPTFCWLPANATPIISGCGAGDQGFFWGSSRILVFDEIRERLCIVRHFKSALGNHKLLLVLQSTVASFHCSPAYNRQPLPSERLLGSRIFAQTDAIKGSC